MGKIKELISEYVHSVPHLSYLFEKREDGRYQVSGDVSIQVKTGDDILNCAVCDISLGGIKIITRDAQLKDVTGVAVKTKAFFAEFPCEAHPRGDHQYLLKFTDMDDSKAGQLDHVLAHYTKNPHNVSFAQML